MTITVYAAPGCPLCDLAVRTLESLDIPFTQLAPTTAHATTHSAHHRLTTEPGYRTTPPPAAADWCGYRPADIDALAARLS